MGYFGRIYEVGRSLVIGMSVTMKHFLTQRSIVTRQYVGMRKPKPGFFGTLFGMTEQYEVGRILPAERFMRKGIHCDDVKPVDYIPERHRGLHTLAVEGCILDKGCMRICPVDCIRIEGVRGGEIEGATKAAKDVNLVHFSVDYALCIFCGLCTENCKPGVLKMGKQYDFASFNQEDLVLNLLTGRPLTKQDREQIVRGRKEIERVEAEKKAAKKAKAAAKKAKAKAAAKKATPGDEKNKDEAPKPEAKDEKKDEAPKPEAKDEAEKKDEPGVEDRQDGSATNDS